MDANGARLLAARIRAGVRIGSTIELQRDVPSEGLHAGDRGVVCDIAPSGALVVSWESGATLELDPDEAEFRKLAA
jgi:hypothetical protein